MNIVPSTHWTYSRNVSIIQVWAASGYYDFREPLNGDSAADGESMGFEVLGRGVPSPFWKGLGPRIFCLIFWSGKFYGPLKQYAKKYKWKNNTFVLC